MFGLGLGVSVKASGDEWVEQDLLTWDIANLALGDGQTGALTFDGSNTNTFNIWYGGESYTSRPTLSMQRVVTDVGSYAGAKVTFDAAITSGTMIIKTFSPNTSTAINHTVTEGANSMIVPSDGDFNNKEIFTYLSGSPAFNVDISNIKAYLPA